MHCTEAAFLGIYRKKRQLIEIPNWCESLKNLNECFQNDSLQIPYRFAKRRIFRIKVRLEYKRGQKSGKSIKEKLKTQIEVHEVLFI